VRYFKGKDTYSVRSKKCSFLKFSDGTLPIFRCRLFSSILSLYLQLGTGRRADFVKKDTPAKVERSKKRPKNLFSINLKIADCGPTSATRELKKEVHVRTQSKNKIKN
jgi:hypothetical protein